MNKVEPDASKYGEILEKCLKMLLEADCLEDFFKGWFRKNEQYFVDCMGSLSATVLTVDHTFKVYNFDSFFFYLNCKYLVEGIYNNNMYHCLFHYYDCHNKVVVMQSCQLHKK